MEILAVIVCIILGVAVLVEVMAPYLIVWFIVKSVKDVNPEAIEALRKAFNE